MQTNRPIWAIDPGTEHSGYVVWHDGAITAKGDTENKDLILRIRGLVGPGFKPDFVIEQMTSYGARVGKTTFDTIWWSGRFFETADRLRCKAAMVPRKDVAKYHVPSRKGSTSVMDSLIYKHMLEVVGAKGTDKAPGPTHGCTGHIYQALALALYAEHLRDKGELFCQTHK